jgi:hypothetical protein
MHELIGHKQRAGRTTMHVVAVYDEGVHDGIPKIGTGPLNPYGQFREVTYCGGMNGGSFRHATFSKSREEVEATHARFRAADSNGWPEYAPGGLPESVRFKPCVTCYPKYEAARLEASSHSRQGGDRG